MFGKKKKNPGYSYFSSDVTLEGRLCFTGIVRLDGRINGEIISTGTLVVEETAIINGDILVENIILSGTVYGNIQASKQVQLNSTAKVFGHINYGELSIEGAMHEGSSHKLTLDEIAIVQKECAELMEEASDRAGNMIPDLSEVEKFTLKPGGSQKRVAASAKASQQALPENEAPRSVEPSKAPRPASQNRAVAKASEPKTDEPKAGEVRAAEAKGSEGRVVEARAADAKVAETKATESKVFEAKATEVKAPEARAAEAKAQDENIAESAQAKEPDASEKSLAAKQIESPSTERAAEGA